MSSRCCLTVYMQRSACVVSIELTHTYITYTVSGREVVSSAGRGRKIVFMGDTCSGDHIAHLAQVAVTTSTRCVSCYGLAG
jgi:hypothetical protein